MNLASIRKRLHDLDDLDGGSRPPTIETGWRPLHLPEAMFGREWSSRGLRACAAFAEHHGLRPDQIVAVGCRGVAQAALMVLRETCPPAEAQTLLVHFLSEVHRDFVHAGLSADEQGEGQRELVDPGTRSWSRKPEIDFVELERLQRELFGHLVTDRAAKETQP